MTYMDITAQQFRVNGSKQENQRIAAWVLQGTKNRTVHAFKIVII